MILAIGIAAVMIVEEPAVDFAGAQLRLNCFDVYHVLEILVVAGQLRFVSAVAANEIT